MNALAALCMLLLGTSTTVSAPASTPHAVQMTHGNLSDPSLSPDGQRMVVIGTVDGKEQLFTTALDGSHATRITHDAWDHEDPAWSPDGRHIALTSMGAGGAAIVVIDPDGQHARRISPASRRAIHPSWSADSQQLFYCTDDDVHPPKKNASEIYQANLATGAIRLVIGGGVNTFPNLSPDGRRLVFRRMLGQHNSEVFVADSDGSHATNLTRSPAFDGWPAWSPDGRRIAFASNRAGPAQVYKIYVMAADGSHVQLVADTDGRATSPKWTAVGRHLLFTICKRAGSGFDCEVYRGDVPYTNRHDALAGVHFDPRRFHGSRYDRSRCMSSTAKLYAPSEDFTTRPQTMTSCL